jgi:hypothetical protein
MPHSYFHCPDCKKRMRMIREDTDKERRFYLCNCGKRVTLMPKVGGMSDDWPKEVFDWAVENSYVTAQGRVLA